MDIVLKGLLGGILISLVLLSGRVFSPAIAGLFTAIPVIFTYSFLVDFYQQEPLIKQLYLFNTFVSASLTAALIGLIFLLTKTFPASQNVNLIVSFVAYFGLLYFYQISLRS